MFVRELPNYNNIIRVELNEPFKSAAGIHYIYLLDSHKFSRLFGISMANQRPVVFVRKG